jgi:hypothetical protein
MVAVVVYAVTEEIAVVLEVHYRDGSGGGGGHYRGGSGGCVGS